MKKLFVLLAVLCMMSFVLAGCGEKTVVEQTTTVQEPTTATEPTRTTTATTTQTNTQTQAAGPDISSLKQDGLNCLEPGIRVCLPVNYARASKGDTVGFAFGLINQFHEEKKFAIKLKFVETQQSLGELPIEVDKEYMLSWLAVNDLETYYTLDTGEKLSKPILVKVKDSVGTNMPTQKGAYVFEVQAQTYEDGFYQDYGGPQKVTVRVE